MRLWIAFVASLVWVGMMPLPASATVISFRIGGEITWIPRLPTEFDVELGDPIAVLFSLDASVEDAYPQPEFSWFARSVIGVSIELGGSTFAMPDPQRVYSGLSNGAGLEVDGDYGDWFHVQRSHQRCCGHPLPTEFPLPTLDALEIAQLRFSVDIEDPEAEIFDTDAIPTRPLDVASAQASNIDVRWAVEPFQFVGWVAARVTSMEVVPEPDVAALLAASLGLVGLIARGNRASAKRSSAPATR